MVLAKKKIYLFIKFATNKNNPDYLFIPAICIFKDLRELVTWSFDSVSNIPHSSSFVSELL